MRLICATENKATGMRFGITPDLKATLRTMLLTSLRQNIIWVS